GLDPARAAAYGARGAEVLVKMSAPEGQPHAPNPLRDSGYGIRNYGVGLALGLDWLHGALRAPERTRVLAALHRWLAAYEERGFEHAFPQGNYFAGYYDAKALAGIAAEGDEAPAQWQDWLGRVHGKLVQPYYAANLPGGGWPEGWNYGPFA